MVDFSFEFQGELQRSGMTIYMYGTHTLTNRDKQYALQSTGINLDLYINQRVLIKGIQLPGYPLDGGPGFIDVKAVEKL